MASENSDAVTTVYQCSECEHCSQNLEEATLHAVQEHGEDRDDDDEVQLEESEEESYPKIHIKEDKHALSSDDEYSSSSIYKQANGHFDVKLEKGTISKSDKWTSSSTRALLECVHAHYPELKNKNSKKKSIWEQIKASIDDQVPGLTPTKCEQKWKTLLASYKKYVSGFNKTYTQSKFKKPEFFDEVAEVVGDDLSRDSSPFQGKGGKGAAGSKDSLAYSLQTLLHDEETSGSPGSSRGSDTVSLLSTLVALLERREATNEKFQREVLEMEREKLRCVQRFVDGREKFNAKKLQLMKEWMNGQPKAKRKREDD